MASLGVKLWPGDFNKEEALESAIAGTSSIFLDPYISQYGEFSRTGILDTAYRGDTILPLVSPKTIGPFSGAPILNPPAFHAKEIYYSDELLTPEELGRKLSTASGKELKTNYQSDEVVERTRKENPFVGGQVLTREIYKLIDMDQVHKQGIPLSTFDQFLDEHKAAAVETFSGAAP
ncbi:hypothetical protein EDB81DRAFT_894967 [Dactylonectria macrodidyma]|uniref:NmrA-like domain-containing protein n=1 Tax=Dactylonectria macrodidyma TaxID=307937 RepID=A0A9P9CZX2_9HYPO|nr:hypothetical protein EDB81DRAFT_894967 [Dactylonectria macrodidyma]